MRTRSHAACARDKYTLLENALGVTAEDRARLAAKARRGLSIFNPDAKRVQIDVTDDPLIPRLVRALEHHAVVGDRTPGLAVAVHSFPGCKRQQWHRDYDERACAAAKVKPRGVLVALEDSTKLSTPSGDIPMSTGDVLIFDGDFVHAGAAYDMENTRVHMYLDSASVPLPRNMTYLIHQT